MSRAGSKRLGARPERALDRSRRRSSRRCPRGARARASRCRRESRRACRTRTPRSPPPSSGRCRAARAIAAASRGKTPPCSGDDRLRRAMQQMRAPVVAQPAPLLEHALDRRGGEARHVGKRRDETLVIGNDGRDLRLLQHDLGQPDAIRIARVLPGQIVAAGAPLPGDQRGREALSSTVAADARRVRAAGSPRRQALPRLGRRFRRRILRDDFLERALGAAAASPSSIWQLAMLSSASGTFWLSG